MTAAIPTDLVEKPLPWRLSADMTADEWGRVAAALESCGDESLAEKALAKRSEVLAPDRVLCAVAASSGVSVSAILGSSKRADIVLARQVAMWLVRDRTDWSYPQIGAMFDRDHTTVMHAVRKIDNALRTRDAAVVDIVGEVTA